MPNECYTLIKQTLCKWGHFEGAKMTLKMLPSSWFFCFKNNNKIFFVVQRHCRSYFTLFIILFSRNVNPVSLNCLYGYFQITHAIKVSQTFILALIWKNPYLHFHLTGLAHTKWENHQSCHLRSSEHWIIIFWIVKFQELFHRS